MKAFLRRFAALLACAVGVAGIANPLPPASPFGASVASAAAPASASPTAAASATAKKSSPTLAPRRPHADPISQAKAVLVAPATFAAGSITAIDSTGSVGDAFEWRISPSDRPFLIGDGRKQAWSFRNAGDPGVADPFAVTLLVFTKAKDGTVASVDVATAIVKPAGVVVVDPVKPPVVVPPIDPTKPVEPPAVDPAVTPTAAVYVYEKDETAVPSAVRSALNRLNRERKIIATEFEDDTVDDSGSTPAQYAIPLAAARKAGLPALVVMAGSEVLSVTLAPTTEEQVLEAAK